MVQQLGIVLVGTHWPAPPFPSSGTYGHGARGAAAVGSASSSRLRGQFFEFRTDVTYHMTLTSRGGYRNSEGGGVQHEK